MKLKYEFKNKQLLLDAVTHSSSLRIQKIRPSERLEFLGDSVLGLCISTLLYKQFPKHTEGELSIMLANLVSTKVVASIALEIGLESMLIMDIGEEQNGGRQNINNLENAMESLLAAIYLDSNYITTQDLVAQLWQPLLNDPQSLNVKNPKSALQEIAQQKYKVMPVYTLIEKTGFAHSPNFVVEVLVSGMGKSIASGNSIKEAEVKAAQQLMSEDI